MSLLTDTLKPSMMNSRLSVLANRALCVGIPVIYMVSVVASGGHTMLTYGTDGIFLVQNTVHLTAHFGGGFFSKNLHDRQNKQRTFSLNKIFSHLILLLLIFFPLSNCLTRTFFPFSKTIFT